MRCSQNNCKSHPHWCLWSIDKWMYYGPLIRAMKTIFHYWQKFITITGYILPLLSWFDSDFGSLWVFLGTDTSLKHAVSSTGYSKNKSWDVTECMNVCVSTVPCDAVASHPKYVPHFCPEFQILLNCNQEKEVTEHVWMMNACLWIFCL